ncbi:hypothetical protein ABFS82_10G104900 [Erythranthe guttata]|nr:PREDICTED: E3 ubiquitin-protein ligase ATL42-like [Erythranthe guttata]|eukprot:XP_012843493.1 PREDICTED: E3 ubiquitin-protein ligase ATL42-like [Erythranthe guttata]
MKTPSLFILQFIFFFFIGTIMAQNFSDSTEGIPSQDSISNFQPSLAVVIGMLSIMFSVTFILLLYAKFCHRTSSSVHTTNGGRLIIRDGLLRSTSTASGVDKTVVESLPFFRFSSLKGSRQGLECSVCLAKFEDVEILRLLPKCKHAFHIDCIDRWLEKHSTCPLCRRRVSADDLSQELPYSDSLRFLSEHHQLSMREESNLELYVQREENSNNSNSNSYSNSNNNNGSSSRFSIIGSSFRKANKEEGLPIKEDESKLLTGSCSELDDGNESAELHRFNHKINYVNYVSNHNHEAVVLKSRWSNVSSSDLLFLNSEMINDVSSARFSPEETKSVDLIINTDQNDDHKKKMTMMVIKQEMERKRAFESKMLISGITIEKNNNDDEGRRVNFPVAFPTTSSSSSSKALNPNNEKRSMSEIVVHPRFINNNNDNGDSISDVKEERMRRLWLPIARKTVKWFANREAITPLPKPSNLHNLHV